MLITIVGSGQEMDLMRKCAKQLESQGHVVHMPVWNISLKWHHGQESWMKATRPSRDVLLTKAASMELQFRNIRQSDAVFVVNEKNGLEYVGDNTVMSTGFALALGKKVFLYRKPVGMFEMRALTFVKDAYVRVWPEIREVISEK